MKGVLLTPHQTFQESQSPGRWCRLRGLFYRNQSAVEVEKSRRGRVSLADRGGERVVNLWRSSLKRSRDFGPFFDPVRPSRAHSGRDRFGTETLASQCECGKPCKERRETKKAERIVLGWLALTPWWTELQAKTKSSPSETLFVTTLSPSRTRFTSFCRATNRGSSVWASGRGRSSAAK